MSLQISVWRTAFSHAAGLDIITVLYCIRIPRAFSYLSTNYSLPVFILQYLSVSQQTWINLIDSLDYQYGLAADAQTSKHTHTYFSKAHFWFICRFAVHRELGIYKGLHVRKGDYIYSEVNNTYISYCT